jgi:hypothetical protein
VYNDKDVNHYIDNGCMCKNCNFQRRMLFDKLKKNEKIIDGIQHDRQIVPAKFKDYHINQRKNIKMMY